MAQPDILVGIIGEGPTDIIVIDALLKGYYSKNLDTTPLQPKEGEPGNWDRVLKYCASTDFKSAFVNPDLIVVIQIDTDVFGTENVPQELALAGMDTMAVPEIVLAMRTLLVEQMTAEFYAMVSDRILFAIAVHQTECWFLPAYFLNDKKKANTTNNCIDKLNEQLIKKEKFYINAKDLNHYRMLCRHFKKKKDIIKFSALNESMGMFIKELDKLPAVSEESTDGAAS